MKDDPIFDKYLEKDDDGMSKKKRGLSPYLISSAELEPRRLREERVDTFIDLGATSVDHEEVW